MKKPTTVLDIFTDYTASTDQRLKQFFAELPPQNMYGHMAYFMGFRDEALQSATVYGGKRFRSAMCAMLADWYGSEAAAQHAVLSLELFHNFTLIHDDIVDGDTMRRGRKTVWALFGVPHAINSGDGQMMLAYEVLTTGMRENTAAGMETGLQLQEFLTAQFRTVIEGQYEDFELTDLSLDHDLVTDESYLSMCGKKTATLIAAATKAAGVAAGQSEDELQALWDYGYELGMAYQLCDDVVSIWGTEAQTGKRLHGDILEQKKTLPVLYVYEKMDEAQKVRLAELFNPAHDMTEMEAAEVVAMMDETDVYLKQRELIAGYAERAKAAADTVSFSIKQKQILKDVVDALLPDIKAAA